MVFHCCIDGLKIFVGWAKRRRAQQDVTFPVGHVTIRSFAQPTSTRQYNIDGVLELYNQ